MTNIDNQQIKGLTIKAAIAVIIFTSSVTWAISSGLNKINSSINDVRQEMHAGIDSVKNKQMIRTIQSDAHFERIELKIDQLAKR